MGRWGSFPGGAQQHVPTTAPCASGTVGRNRLRKSPATALRTELQPLQAKLHGGTLQLAEMRMYVIPVRYGGCGFVGGCQQASNHSYMRRFRDLLHSDARQASHLQPGDQQ